MKTRLLIVAALAALALAGCCAECKQGRCPAPTPKSKLRVVEVWPPIGTAPGS